MSTFKKIILSTLLFLFSIFLTKQFFFFTSPGIAEKTCSKLIYPILWLSNTLSSPIKKFLEEQKIHKNTVAKYKKLKQKYSTLKNKYYALEAQFIYLENCEELRKFKERYNKKDYLIAKILIRNFSPEEHYLIVGMGEKDGITKNMLALYENHIIGKIVEVYPYYSKVVPLTDSKSKIAGYTNRTKAAGILIGINDISKCKFQYASHLLDIQEGDTIYTSGKGLIYPEGFILGKIVKCQKDKIYYKIEVKPELKLDSIDFCFLVKQKDINPF